MAKKENKKRFKKLTLSEAIVLLDEVRTIANGILKDCSEIRIPHVFSQHIPNHWCLSLYASIIGSARSIAILLQHQQYWDSILIGRSIYDALIDLRFLIYFDPNYKNVLIFWYGIEELNDIKELLHSKKERLAKFTEKTECRRDLWKIQQDYLIVKRVFKNTKARYRNSKYPNPRHWRQLDREKKKEDTLKQAGEESPSIKELDFEFRILGDAAAHRRPIMLKDMRVEKDIGSYEYTSRPKLDRKMLKPQLLILPAFISLLEASMNIVKYYGIEPKWNKKLTRVHAKWIERVKNLDY